MISQNSANVCPYWVGDIFVTTNEVDPAERWAGTSWEQISDCMLRAADEKHPAGTTGGAWEIKQTVAQMPKHRHAYESYQSGYPNSHTGDSTYITPIATIPHSENPYAKTESCYVGDCEPMDITNKYLAVYMWKRTA